MPAVSAVLSTFERPDACERALASALSQEPSPIEVLVCDDGSADDTPERFRAWERRDPRVRYLRSEPNRGTPGITRNLGLEQARGEWVAFLDDDDMWLSGKLERQLALAHDSDVIGANAVRVDGKPYLEPGAGVTHPNRAAVINDNPLILSTVIAPRRLIREAGGFLTQRWARGVADYAMWLTLADRGARFAVLDEPLVLYESDSEDRMSAAPVRQELAVSRLAWRRLWANPRDPLIRRAALNRSYAALRLAWDRPRMRPSRRR